MTGKKRTRDERLFTGSIIRWSRRKDPYVPVVCGSCGRERLLLLNNATRSDFSGICRACTNGENWQDVKLSNGSVVLWSRRKGQRVPVTCGNCGAEHITFAHNIRKETFTGLCRQCRHTGTASNTWRGGRIMKNGYIYVKIAPNHPFYSAMATSTGYVLEHRLVVAEHLGRPLRETEVVHHKNANKTDNRLENLELFISIKEHRKVMQQRHPHPGYESVDNLSSLYRWLKKLFEPEA
jgi:predicted RNA-binding Zn-ribbon protein involved in translation (DUF1610 family)